MSFIEVKNIKKTFKVPLKEEGKFSVIKGFFNRKYRYIKAIDNISFSMVRSNSALDETPMTIFLSN